MAQGAGSPPGTGALRQPGGGGCVWKFEFLGRLYPQPGLDKGEFSYKPSRVGKVKSFPLPPRGFSPRCFHHTDACEHPSACGEERRGGVKPFPFSPRFPPIASSPDQRG